MTLKTKEYIGQALLFGELIAFSCLSVYLARSWEWFGGFEIVIASFLNGLIAIVAFMWWHRVVELGLDFW